ncbi:MAG: hypothetical protein Q4A65_05210 [Bacillota bacterium]|nr:hypothetical protein [Bacillota bacterium]
MKLPLKKQLMVVIMAGVLMIAVDFISGSGEGNLVFRDADGNVTIVRPEEGGKTGHVILKAKVKGKDGTYEQKFELSVDPRSKADADREAADGDDAADGGEETSARELASYEIRNAVSAVNDDISARKVILPSTLSTGEKIYWSTGKKTNTIPLLFITLTICIFLYRRTLSLSENVKKAQRNSISKQLPEFVNKLVLLLNAGLVLSAAFEKAVEESLDSKNIENDYFYCRMRDIYTSVTETNSSFNNEFRAFAKESGNNSLMRISNILNDNISKGVALTDKLQREGETLWLNRKRDCEERGRISETKLTLPLTLFLLVLIVITVSPALLEL